MSGVTRQFRVIGDHDDDLSLRVAFASDNGTEVNQHFGSTRALVIYRVNPERTAIESILEFEDIGKDEGETKLAAKLNALEGCIAVYCRACGASAVRQLIDMRVQPLKVVYDSSIKELLAGFQQELREGPSSWLARAIAQNGEGHTELFDSLDRP